MEHFINFIKKPIVWIITAVVAVVGILTAVLLKRK